MSVIDGFVRGMEVVDIGGLISVFVGDEILGRIFNVFGKLVDGKLVLKFVFKLFIYRLVLVYDELEIIVEILEIGIKVVDLLVLYLKGGKIGLFGGVGVGKIVLI